MKINVISIESSRPEWAEKAFRSYESKFNKSISINWIGLKPLNRNRNYNHPEIVEQESELLFSKIKKKDFVIFDMRNIYSPLKMKNLKIKYFAVGRQSN